MATTAATIALAVSDPTAPGPASVRYVPPGRAGGGEGGWVSVGGAGSGAGSGLLDRAPAGWAPAAAAAAVAPPSTPTTTRPRTAGGGGSGAFGPRDRGVQAGGGGGGRVEAGSQRDPPGRAERGVETGGAPPTPSPADPWAGLAAAARALIRAVGTSGGAASAAAAAAAAPPAPADDAAWWEDPSDVARPAAASFLPLWCLGPPAGVLAPPASAPAPVRPAVGGRPGGRRAAPAPALAVTALDWAVVVCAPPPSSPRPSPPPPSYSAPPPLLAVGYGGAVAGGFAVFDPVREGGGGGVGGGGRGGSPALAAARTASPVSALAFSPAAAPASPTSPRPPPLRLAVGCGDGSVAVYGLVVGQSSPTLLARSAPGGGGGGGGQHGGPVRGVAWFAGDGGGEEAVESTSCPAPLLATVSSDGSVALWTQEPGSGAGSLATATSPPAIASLVCRPFALLPAAGGGGSCGAGGSGGSADPAAEAAPSAPPPPRAGATCLDLAPAGAGRPGGGRGALLLVGDDAGGARILSLGSGPDPRAWLQPARGGGGGGGWGCGGGGPASTPLSAAKWCRLTAPSSSGPPALLTAGFDGRLRLWTVSGDGGEHGGGGGGGGTTTPAAVFDLGAPLTDAAWLGGPPGGGEGTSTSTSTTSPAALPPPPPPPLAFVAALADGRLAGFELTRKPGGPIALQRVVRAGVRPTRVAACPPCAWGGWGSIAFAGGGGGAAFPGASPLVAVGDDAGRVTLLKPSPNLRSPAPPAPPAGGGGEGTQGGTGEAGGRAGVLPTAGRFGGGRGGVGPAAAAAAALLAAVAVPPPEEGGGSSEGAAPPVVAAVAADDERGAAAPGPAAPPLSPAAAAMEKAVVRLVKVLAELRASGAGEE